MAYLAEEGLAQVDTSYILLSLKRFLLYVTPLEFLIIFSFNKGENDRTLSDKFEINLLIKLILPSKDCNSVLVVGGTASSIAFILFDQFQFLSHGP